MAETSKNNIFFSQCHSLQSFILVKQELHFAIPAIRAYNELDILRWLGKEGGIMKASTTNEGGSSKYYTLYGGIS